MSQPTGGTEARPLITQPATLPTATDRHSHTPATQQDTAAHPTGSLDQTAIHDNHKENTTITNKKLPVSMVHPPRNSQDQDTARTDTRIHHRDKIGGPHVCGVVSTDISIAVNALPLGNSVICVANMIT